MAPPRKTEFPCFGCIFCTSRFATEVRCGQHLDTFLPEYRDAYRYSPPVNLVELHPEDIIRAARRVISYRGTSNPIIWKEPTLRIPDGVNWNFIVPLTSKAGLRAYLARPIKTTNEWIVQLGAIVLPPAHVARLSPRHGYVLPAAVLPAVTPPHSPVASLSVGHRAVGPNVAIGNSTGANTSMLARRRRRIETPSPPAAASIYDRAGGPAAASPTPLRRKKPTVGATSVSLGVNARNMIFDFTGDVNAAQESPGRATCPIAVDDDDAPAAVRRSRAAAPVAPTPVTASRAALMAEFFTPGNDAPNFFQIKIVGTGFCVSVGHATTLQVVIDTVQRGLLDPLGYPPMSGLKGEGEDRCWDERMWADVKKSGASSKELYVMAEMEF